jgi:chemotaxis protein methyltransferase CheR
VRSELERVSGLPLTEFRSDHVRKQIARACARSGVDGEAALAGTLRRDGAARRRFRRSIAISHGALFRDPAQWVLLEDVLLPRLLAHEGTRLSVWSAGCADGAELHTAGLVLARLGVLERSVLLGSDLLEENVAAARAGTYPPAVRARMRWEQRDLAGDGPPPGRWRLVLCRNVAIYLSRAARERLYATLVGALGTRGVLLLGRSERLSDPAALGLRPAGPHAYERVA